MRVSLTSSNVAFEASELKNRAENCQRSVLLATIFLILGSITDRFAYPETASLFFGFRVLTSLILLALLRPLRSRKPYVIAAVSHLAATIPLILILWMIFRSGDPAAHYHQGLGLLIVGAAMILRWRFIDSVVHCLISITSYTVLYLVMGGPTAVLISNLYFLIATAALSTLGIYFYNNLRYREFYLREEVNANRHALQHNNEKLQALDEAKNRFFANVSHELRTPLTLILGPIEQLTSLPSLKNDPNAQSHIDTLSENGFRLLRMINDLLEIARLETGDIPERLENIDLQQFAEGMRRSLAAMAESKNIDFEVSTQVLNTPIQAFDRSRLEKILLNLCINALKFTPNGGKVRLRIREDERQLNIMIADNGMGMSQEELPHIFDRFWQADSSSRRKSRGTGIGLALSKNLAESMNGQLYVISAPDDGTTFTLSLPISPARNDLADPIPAMPEEDAFDLIHRRTLVLGVKENVSSFPPLVTPPVITSNPATILVVDDEISMRSYIASFLSPHNVLEAADGREGLDMARKHIPDLIILDYMMPEMNGVEVAGQLRSQAATSRIPIVLITAHGGDAPRIAALEVGVNDFITKPFFSSELTARVQNLLLSQRYQTELQSSNQDLSEALDQLRDQGEELVRSEKLSSLGQMSAGIVHEINNPLNYANTGIHLLKTFRQHLPESELEDYDETIADLGDAVQRVIRIITDLRALTRGGEIFKSPIDFYKIIENATRFLSDELKKVRLLIEVPEDLSVFGNDNQLCQVFVNLIQNAVHASTKKDRPIIMIKATSEDDFIKVSVSDNGHGIPDSIRRKIFDPFFTTKDVGIGMGLGLSLTLKTIEDHGGVIQVDSSQDRGTHFKIFLPRNKQAQLQNRT